MAHNARLGRLRRFAAKDYIGEFFVLVSQAAGFKPPVQRTALQSLREVAPVVRSSHGARPLVRTGSHQVRPASEQLLARLQHTLVSTRSARLDDGQRQPRLLPGS